MKKLAIVSTHPIQYYAPVFKLLAGKKSLSVKVFYTWGEDSVDKYDPGFGRKIAWDIPLLDGYDYEFLKNESRDAGTHHFKGIINRNVIERIKAYQPDALLVYGWSWHSHLKVLRYFKNKVPVYFRGDSNLLDDYPGIKTRLRHLFIKWLYRFVDAAFYVGSANKAYYLKAGLNPGQLFFAPHAIDNNRFSEDHSCESQKLRRQLNITEDEILVVFAGKLEEKKNPRLLLDTILRMDKPKVHLLFTGNGELEAELKNAAKEQQRIHFMDFQNQLQLPSVYQAADLFCLPSKGPGETWGLAVNEAMAAGKAILVSDKAGCAADLIRENVNGKMFKSSSEKDFEKALWQLTESRDQLRKMGEASAQIIRDWTFANQATSFEKVINQC